MVSGILALDTQPYLVMTRFALNSRIQYNNIKFVEIATTRRSPVAVKKVAKSKKFDVGPNLGYSYPIQLHSNVGVTAVHTTM